jgi:hypothetical protein
MKKLLALMVITQMLGGLVSAQQLTAYNGLINNIQNQEVKFPFPQKDTIVNIGQININNGNPVITYLIPIDGVRRIFQAGHPEPDLHPHRPGEGPIIVGQRTIIDTDRAVINVNQHLRFDLRFTIKNWNPSAGPLTVTVGSQTKIAPSGLDTLLFSNILDTDPVVSCHMTNAAPIVHTVPLEFHNNVLHINWNTVGAGIITLPVLPVKVIYAPVVDCRKQNTASISETIARNYNTSFSINQVNSTTTPVTTSLSGLDDMLHDISGVANVLSLGIDTSLKKLAAPLNTIVKLITDAFGFNTITRTITNSVTSQQTFSINSSGTESIIAKSSNGGPGDGDVICYYRDVNLLWFCNKGKMTLAVIGYDLALNTPAAKQLKQGLLYLASHPEAKKDTSNHLDTFSLQALLALDPFTGPDGPRTQLDPARFTPAYKLDGSLAVFHNGGADITGTSSTQITTGSSQTSVETTTTVEVDKPGFLSFLGLGETEDHTIQSTFTRSSSSQLTIGNTYSQGYALHGDASCDNYYCEMLFDSVFGSLAFRDNSADLNENNSVSGVLVNATGSRLLNTDVLLSANSKNIWTKTDSHGKFSSAMSYRSDADSVKVTALGGVVKLDAPKKIAKASPKR